MASVGDRVGRAESEQVVMSMGQSLELEVNESSVSESDPGEPVKCVELGLESLLLEDLVQSCVRGKGGK